MDNAIPGIDGWKAHILRAAHQDTAKKAVVENLADNQVLIIMDWAMNFSHSVTGKHNRIGLGKRECRGMFLSLSKRRMTVKLRYSHTSGCDVSKDDV